MVFFPRPYTLEKFHWNVNDPIQNKINSKYEFKIVNNELFLSIRTPADFIQNQNLLSPFEIDPSIEVNITQSSDDAADVAGVFNSNDSSYKLVTSDQGQLAISGWRFQSITISQGAIISDADLEMATWRSASFGGTSNATCWGTDEDDLATWSNESNRPKDATKTSNYYSRIDTGGSDLANGIYVLRNWNVTKIIQEIVNITNWSSGNDLGFICEKGDGSSFGVELTAYTYDSIEDYPKPTLTIEYEEIVTNETLAREAIVEGINNTTPNATIYTDLEVNIRYMNGTQNNGVFDKVAFLSSQRWGFNYITESENYTNMSSSSYNIFNVWENTSLTYDQIVSQVENYINETLS
jgi:hypothetical protein